jgi:hypothetical protein
MKFYILIYFFLTIQGSFASWDFIHKDKNNTSIFIDSSSIKVFNTLRYAWTMLSLDINNENIKKTGFTSYVTHEYFNCNNKTRASLIEIKFYKAMGQGKAFYDSYPDAVIDKPIYGSLGSRLIEKVCNYAKVDDKQQ